MTRALGAGSEIDAWCTRCRLDLGHRIVALVAGVPKRVVCQTCGSEHNYHRPRTSTAAVVRRGRDTGAAPTAPRPAGPARTTSREREEAARSSEWARRIAGQPLDAFVRYGADVALREGMLVRHAKFGEGYVVSLLDGQKASVMFQDGPRTLACARG